MHETLDLTGSDADNIGFPAVPSGRYEAHVGKAEWRETENIDGSKALPHGTRYLALGIQVNEDAPDVDGQKVANVYCGWTNLFVVPADYDAQKGQRMKNAWANFLKAAGIDYEKKGFTLPTADDVLGLKVTAVVRKKYDKVQGKDVNEIEGFKPAGQADAVDSGSGGGLGLR